MARAKKSLHDLNVSTCSTCLAWHSIKVGADEKARGYCRLNPPEIMACDDDGNVVMARPIMESDEWCMQHRPRVVN